MKKIFKKIVFICISMMFVFSCTTNDFEQPNDGAGRALALSNLDRGRKDEPIQARVGDTTITTDLSIFSQERTWTVTQGTVDIIGSSNDITSNKKMFSAIFNTPGEVEIVLEPDFNGPTPMEVSTDTINFNVLAQITANFKTDLPMVDGLFQIEAGETGTFVNTSSELENADWLVTNTTTNREEPIINTISLSFQFRALGEYSIRLRSFTDTPFSQDFITKNVRVVPSTRPVELVGIIEENEDGSIVIAYSRDLDPTTLDDISNFTLMVDGAPASIASIGLDSDNAANLLVTPTVNIKNSQTATIEYNAVNLTSADVAPAPSVPQTSVRIFGGTNLFANGVFEDIDSSVPGRFYGTANNFQGSDNNGNISIAIEPNVGIGNSSAMVYSFAPTSAEANNRSAFGDGMRDDPLGRVVQEIKTLEQKTYLVRASIKYMGTAPTFYTFSVTSFPFSNPGIVGGDLTSAPFPNPPLVNGQFVEVTTLFTPNTNTLSAGGLAYPIIRFGGINGASTVIIDNIEIYELEE